eukprot:scaffold34071_cov48-Phaeocystis_antarctica.AAC.5
MATPTMATPILATPTVATPTMATPTRRAYLTLRHAWLAQPRPEALTVLPPNPNPNPNPNQNSNPNPNPSLIRTPTYLPTHTYLGAPPPR